jgi:hypothetical protein
MPDLKKATLQIKQLNLIFHCHFRKLGLSFSEGIMEANQEEKRMDKNIIQVAFEGLIC